MTTHMQNDKEPFLLFFFFSVRPTYHWSLNRLIKDRIPGSPGPAIRTHGEMKVIRGGLHLNGHNAWLGAGDFSGGCISGRVKFSQYSECYLEDARAHSLNIFQTVSFWTERMSTDAKW